ncbi:DUF4476 domain-containing protein [Hymenobacter sp. BT770]|uniref:DUF4476 domain-containing protein n=1 Tax=Hymenobacter sp. BT770 TaxID=2886942 RepID=UPI001D1057E4|nr:DUF4476 domain-containing protein [Hymenobacter sp. BT770]MCC3155405.1 DUF4476 domain-containing protein [Hymenobacter sp. BT770]MDO3417418.1 DUF4476 domain-containing protein [Hymenobacter sp. BT770]
MKKALLLALAGLLAAVAPALAYPPAPANVNFSSERGVPFGLVLDGRPITRGMARQVHVEQLGPGLHWADFTVPTAYGGAVRFRSRVWLEPGLETTFVLITRPGRPLDLRQVTAVPLYGPGRGYYNDGRNGGRYNSPAPYGQGGSYPNNGYPNNSYPNNGGNQNNGGNPNNGSYPNNGNNQNNGYGNTPGGYDNSPNPNGGGSYPNSAANNYRTMAPQEVDALVQAVQQRPFEASKLSMAKEALAQSSIQTDDLKRLLRSIQFESARVELAKFAYSHVVDPQNFSRVYDAFDFDASVREVQQAVGAAPQR